MALSHFLAFLQMIYYVLTTAFIVSIDSLMCGLSLSLNSKKKNPIVFTIVLTVLIMCLATNYLTGFFKDKLNDYTASLGGIILICVGIFNLLKTSNPKINDNSPIKDYFFTGFAVGLDGAFANLSLSLMGLNEIYVPLIIAIMHGIMISLGIYLSQTKIVKKLAKIGFMPPLILILLGAYKLLGLLI